MNRVLRQSPRGERGFTLIELMVTLTIAGILLGIAVPSFSSFIRTNRAQVQSSAIANSLSFARAEAIRRSTTVRVLQASGGWSKGWDIFVDSNNNGSLDSGEDKLRSVPAVTGGATLSNSDTSVVFDRSGATSATPGTSTFEYRLGSGYCKLERNISVNHLGRIIIERRSC